MAVSNRERIGNALESLKKNLTPYVTREMQRKFGKEWETQLRTSSRSLDVSALLYCILNHWDDVFGQKLGRVERNYVSELIEVRNNWAHQGPLSFDDTDRALDTTVRLLRAISAPDADEVDRELQEFRRARYGEQTKGEQKLAAVPPPPYVDIRPSRQQAEIAANLAGRTNLIMGRISKAAQLCECGCGDETAGGRFRPGHDAKLKSRLIRTARAEDENKDVSVCEAAWDQLVELGWSHMFDEEQTLLTAEMNRMRAARSATKVR